LILKIYEILALFSFCKIKPPSAKKQSIHGEWRSMTAKTREQQLLDEMLAEWGYLMGNAGLRKAFGFPNVPALRFAIGKGTLPVHVFTIRASIPSQLDVWSATMEFSEQIIQHLVAEHWVVDGVPQPDAPGDADAMYIKPLMLEGCLLPLRKRTLHSLVIDNNIFIDLVDSRRPENKDYLQALLRSVPLELNPTIAIVEQRQKFPRASEELAKYAEYLANEFGHTAARDGTAEFEANLFDAKASLVSNTESFTAYLAAIVYLYHLDKSASEKFIWLSGMVRESDLPFFPLQFFFAALVFLVKERPLLFSRAACEKVTKDMKVKSDVAGHANNLANLANDLLFPTLALFGSNSNVTVVPYVATRDRLVQIFLSQIFCGAIHDLGNGRCNGEWGIMPGCVLDEEMGDLIRAHYPKRSESSRRGVHVDNVAVRKGRLEAFKDNFIRLALSAHQKGVPIVVE
jgi:hypothetical protein